MEPTNQFDSKYRYILVAARRARQLQNGAGALVSSASRKACKVAQDEMQAGVISYVVPEKKAKPAEAAPEAEDE